MRQLRFTQVDVFTRTPFRGNPVAVVLGADVLATEAMQRIAGWTNLSETAFVLAPSTPQADYRLRIFTPRAELPFAGHPTIGSAHAVLEAELVKPKAGRFRQECGAGILELTLEDEMIWVKAPPAKTSPFPAERVAELEAALGCKLASLPISVNVGPTWLVADVGNAEILAGLVPSMQRISELSDSFSITGITVFGAAADGKSTIQVRSFAPAHGVPEDPVCGSGNISVAAYLSSSAQLERYGARYQSRQGMQLGRDGRVAIRVEKGEIFLGGNAVTCVEGALRVE